MDVLLASPSGHEVADQSSVKGPSTPKAEKSTDARDGSGEWGGGDAASACALWCSMAMGALVQGQPPEEVRTVVW